MAVKFNYLILYLFVIIAIGDSITGYNNSTDVINFLEEMKQFTCSSNNFTCKLAVQPPQTINIEKDAKALYQAIQIKATNEVIKIICSRSLVQRLAIATKFEKIYNKNLVDEINGLGSTGLEKFSFKLFTPPWQHLAQVLFDAIDGWGTSEEVLITTLVPLSNKAVRTVSDYYKQQYGRLLAEDIKGDTSGYFQSLLLLLSAGARNESNFNQDNNRAAIEIAQTLYKHQNEETFNFVLATASLPDLRKSFVEYKNISGKNIEDVINNEFDDIDLITAYSHIVDFAKSPPECFAHLIQSAFMNAHISFVALFPIDTFVVQHSDIDLGTIKETYEDINGVSLVNQIKEEFDNSDFWKIVLALVGP